MYPEVRPPLKTDDRRARHVVGTAARPPEQWCGGSHALRPSWSVRIMPEVTDTNSGRITYSSSPSAPGGWMETMADAGTLLNENN